MERDPHFYLRLRFLSPVTTEDGTLCGTAGNGFYVAQDNKLFPSYTIARKTRLNQYWLCRLYVVTRPAII